MAEQKIFHYTSVESLALIFKTRKLRFSRLDGVDDVREAQHHVGIDFGKFFFISCWTLQSEESIPQWHMYSRDMQGIRLELPAYPFSDIPLRPMEGSDGLEIQGNPMSPLSFEELWGPGYFIVPIFLYENLFCGPVSYVPNIEDEYSRSVRREVEPNGHVKLKIEALHLLPRRKSQDWAFQKEFRFSLFIMPSLSIPEFGFKQAEFLSHAAEHISNSFIHNVNPGIHHVDLPLSEAALSTLTVRTGPLMSPGDRVCVEALLARYAPSANLETSSLTGSVRAKSS